MKLPKFIKLTPILIVLLSFLNATYGQITYRDEFETQDYGRNDGNRNWSNNWTEINGDLNDPAGGTIRVFLGNINVLLFQGGTGHSLSRNFNSAGATAVTLTFDWGTQGLDTGFTFTEELGIFISNDNGASFNQVGAGTITGNPANPNNDSFGSATIDISGAISADSVIRFQVIGGNQRFEFNELAFVDNVQINVTIPSVPLITVNNISVNENAGTATFEVSHIQGATVLPFTVDYNTAEITAVDDTDYTGVSGTLTFTGIPGGPPQLVTVPIINNNYLEDDEQFGFNLSNPSNANVITSNGIATIVDGGVGPAIPTDTPLTLFREFNGTFDYVSTGGTFRDDANDTCSITDTSSNQLTSDVTPGAAIEIAYLIWTRSGSSSDDNIVFENQPVSADFINKANFNSGREFYSMLADVTSIINTIPIADLNTNVFDVGNLSIDNTGTHCSANTTLGGWALFIIYEDPSLLASSINFYQGFDGVNNESQSFTLDGFFAIGSTEAKTTVLSWEGDLGLADGESLTLTTSLGINVLNGDGDNTGAISNPFNSTIYDNTDATIVNTVDTFGIDLDTYDISPFITQGESTATTNVNVGADFVLLNNVLLKVPSNLIVGTVFEDINYGGGNGRNLATSNGVGAANVTLELFREFPDGTGIFIPEESTTTNATGTYSFGGMPNGNYQLKVNNNTVRSTRPNGATCTTCIPVQTFRREYTTTTNTYTDITTEIGGANPSQVDPTAANTLAGSQTISNVSIDSEGIVDFDFGFNFNTIVNTNRDGQGSLEQFIVNSNELGETGLDIEAHPNDAALNPPAGEDTSIFMMPPTADPFGRTADVNFNFGRYFDIFLPNSVSSVTFNLTPITGTNTHIDGRTQTAYSGDTNSGAIGLGGILVGTSAFNLPDYLRPEIQVHQNSGNVFRSQGTGTIISDLSIYSNNRSAIQLLSGDSIIERNLIGVNAFGVNDGDIRNGIAVFGANTSTIIQNNYIATIINYGIRLNAGNNTIIQNNHITNNGNNSCFDNILIQGGATGITIQRNLIEQAAAFGIDANLSTGNISIEENTIRGSGQNGGLCSGVVENAGIVLSGDNSTIRNNIINNNGGSGLVLGGGNTSGNLISQNSFFANGTTGKALGIDIDTNTGKTGDGVSLNDTADIDNGPNGVLNFPIFDTATIRGNVLKVTGWARPGAIIEIFLTDVQLGTATSGDNQLPGLSADYGEGQLYLTSVTEGSPLDTDGNVSVYTDDDANTDLTNRFNISIPLTTTIPLVGNFITGTATVANTTSEFSRVKILSLPSVITNRRITYRANPN